MKNKKIFSILATLLLLGGCVNSNEDNDALNSSNSSSSFIQSSSNIETIETNIIVDQLFNEDDEIVYKGIKYKFNNNEFSVIGYEGDIVDVTILSSINGYPVTSIDNFAFSSCSSLAGIVIPEGVTSIGYEAFSWCRNLTSIEVDENNVNYKSIEGNLYSKDGKELIQYAIGKEDTEFKVPEGVKSIGGSAFMDCSGLTNIILPSTLTSIGDSAFSNCSSLTSVILPATLTSIGDSAFSGCSSLTSIVIPEGVTSIGYSAFFGCSILTIYCEVSWQPEGWNEYWNISYRLVYYAGEWEYVDGVPTPIK